MASETLQSTVMDHIRKSFRRVIGPTAIALLTLTSVALGVAGLPVSAAATGGTASQPSPPAAQDNSTAAPAKDFQQRLTEADAELDAVSTPETLAAGAPPGTS